ncbi:MAG: hypothetical protein IPM79_07600 [Polyangiaceae bacterium]|nr:hypothetical protein [Polyangiaceae bacterium]MBK8937497.1 hypothetical protein [Polyangiaceae bacterium]
MNARASAPPPPALERLDPDGLLCALALAPSTYSRNRSFGLYEERSMRSIARRARILRGLVRQLARAGAERTTRTVGDLVEIELVVPALGYRRVSRLTPLEHDLVLYLLSRAGSAQHDDARHAQTRVEAALARLSGLVPSFDPGPPAPG